MEKGSFIIHHQRAHFVESMRLADPSTPVSGRSNILRLSLTSLSNVKNVNYNALMILIDVMTGQFRVPEANCASYSDMDSGARLMQMI